MSDVPTIGSMIWEGNYNVKNSLHIRYGKDLKYFEYNWKTPEDEKIVVWSDLNIPTAQLPKFSKVPYKVAWMMEGPGVYQWGQFAPIKEWLLAHLDIFTMVATCNDSLVAQYPDKFVFVPFGGIAVPLEKTQIYEKTKLCSMTAGHMYPPRYLVRDIVADSGKVDILGRAYGKPYVTTDEGFADYMYHLTIASSCVNRYFSSNLMDAFACGTIPIWWGCPGISDFFDMNGVIVINPAGRSFDTFATDEFKKIMEMINPDDYKSRSVAIKTNHQLVEKFRTPDNTLWENVLEQLYGK